MIELIRVELCRPEATVERLRGWLAPDEEARRRRFLSEVHRVRYAVARGALRAALAARLGVEPGAVRFRYAGDGKPGLDDSMRAPELRFNLSHSEDLALIAITRAGEIGVDVEKVRADRDLLGIATRFFSAREVEALHALPAPAQPGGFYDAWTRKEAYVKAIGTGLQTPLASFSVSLGPGREAALLEHLGDPGEPARWELTDLPTDAGFRAALCSPRGAGPLQWVADPTAKPGAASGTVPDGSPG